ncbi:MAG: SRPBCC family protein [Pseudomonadota bacterium]
MKFTAKDDIEADLSAVFRHVTDFASFERSIMRRGGDVQRLTPGDTPQVGMSWRVKFRLRGKERDVTAHLTEFDAPNGLVAKLTSKNLDAVTTVELVALSRVRTRLIVTIDASPKTLAAKLLFQSMRFGKSRVQNRFQSMVTAFARDIEKAEKPSVSLR